MKMLCNRDLNDRERLQVAQMEYQLLQTDQVVKIDQQPFGRVI